MPDVLTGHAAQIGVPRLGDPYRVVRWMLTVEVECRQCEAHATVTLVNNQPARCPRCGAEYACGGFRWDVTTAAVAARPPQFAISASPPAKPVS